MWTVFEQYTPFIIFIQNRLLVFVYVQMNGNNYATVFCVFITPTMSKFF